MALLSSFQGFSLRQKSHLVTCLQVLILEIEAMYSYLCEIQTVLGCHNEIVHYRELCTVGFGRENLWALAPVNLTAYA